MGPEEDVLPGDQIVAIDGRPVKSWEEVQYEVLPRPDRDLALKVLRGATERDVTVRPLPKGQDKVGDIGVHPLVRISAVVEGSPAEKAGIKAGDLLTTSPTRGHAQKVLDPGKATGSIIGKALGSLKKGKGEIPLERDKKLSSSFFFFFFFFFSFTYDL